MTIELTLADVCDCLAFILAVIGSIFWAANIISPLVIPTIIIESIFYSVIGLVALSIYLDYRFNINFKDGE